jgi:DNA-binding NarL/FixJ family response regulator
MPDKLRAPDQLITVVILDDEDSVRNWISLMIDQPDIQVIGAFSDPKDCIDFIKSSHPDVAIIDLMFRRMPPRQNHMPPGQDFAALGLEVLEKIKSIEPQSNAPQTKCLVYTHLASTRTLIAAVEAGADGYIWKHSWSARRPPWDQIIHILMADGKFFDMELVTQLIPYVHMGRLPVTDEDRRIRQDRKNPLTVREQEVLLAYEELLRISDTSPTYNELGSQLGITPNGAKAHFKNIFAKLQVHSREESLAVATSQGYL